MGLLEHLHIVHGKKMSFECKYCEATFNLPSALKYHKETSCDKKKESQKCEDHQKKEQKQVKMRENVTPVTLPILTDIDQEPKPKEELL